MPEVIETVVYPLDELDGAARERARAWFRRIGFDDDWHEAVNDDFARVCAILGVDLRTVPVRLFGGGTRAKPCIFFSGFWSQGDGACFEGRYAYAPGGAAAIRAHAPRDADLHAIADALGAVQRRHFYQLRADIRHHGRYYHEHSMAIAVERDSPTGQDVAAGTQDGRAIAHFLDDPTIVEVMLNPDGRLWIDRLSDGLADTGERLNPADGERIVRLVAHHVGAEVHAGAPRVSAELPETGERFEGLLPPVVAAPAFAIRKPPVAVFTLDDYANAGIMSFAQAALLRLAVGERKKILVAGGTSTGKTTLTNALLAEVARWPDRVVLIEDTRELQCAALNLVAMRTKDGVASLSDLVRSALRLRPDRIPIGEVRGAEALDLLKAWGTGHPGGIGTIHAGSAIGSLRRMEQLIQEAVVTVPRALIAETIDLVAVLAGRGSQRRLAELARVEGLGPDGDYRVVSATTVTAGSGAAPLIPSDPFTPGDQS